MATDPTVETVGALRPGGTAITVSTVGQQDWLPYVTGLRGLAALFVLLHHVHYATFILADHGLQDTPFPFLWFGNAAVSMFLVVSGYCLLMPIVSRSELRPARGWTDFFWRRVKRILPAYYLVLGICLLLIQRFPQELHELLPDPYWPVVFYHVMLVHNWWGAQAATIDGPMWSIATEWQIYWLMPLIVAAWRKLPVVHVVLAGVVLASIPAWFDQEPAHGLHLIASFLLGAAAADIVHRSHPASAAYRKLPWKSITAVLWTIVIVETTKHWGDSWGHLWQLDQGVGAAGASLLVYLGLGQDQPSLVRRMLSARIPYELGLISYSLYLIHQPLMLIFRAHTTLLPWDGPPDCLWHFLYLLSLTLLAVPAAWCIYLVAEKPFQSRHVPGWAEVSMGPPPPPMSPDAKASSRD